MNADQMGMRQMFRRGLQLSPEFRKGLGVTLALAAMAAMGRAATPFLTQRVTDQGLLAPDGVAVDVVVRYALGGSVVLIASAILAWQVRRRMVAASEAGLATLRIRAFGKVHELSVLTQNEEQRGRYVSRVTGDVETIRDLMQWTGAAMIIAALESFTVFVVMVLYSWQLSLLVLLAFIPMVVSLLWIQPRVRRAFQGVRSRVADLLGKTSEQLVGVSTIRAYGVQQRMRDQLNEEVDAILVAEKRASLLASLNFSSTVVGQSLATGLALIGGTHLALRGDLSVGTVVAFAFLVYMFSGPLMWIIEMLAEMQRAIVGWRRVIGLVDQDVTVADPGEDGTRIPHGRGDLSIEGVRLTYPGGPEVLKGIDLDLPAGRRLALVGQTGSGKTTLARLMSRFFDPTEGVVRVGGVDLRDVPMESLRRSVAVVPQEGFLFDGSILSNLEYALPGVTGEDLERRALAAFESLGLEGWLKTLPNGLRTHVGPRGELLSAGERQLVSIARAYLRDPDLLILDEATSAVDPATEVRISRALEGLMQGRTAVVIAHRLSTAERADLVAVMEQGELVEVGPHSELVGAGGIYSRLHEAWVAQTRD
ncbi:ABC transporter ATP-binding protein [Demequina sp. SYSU T00039]|uniref:ABC transporter ATP-binding protein n=1 Tax=Demequina lignilytica TaxID=3051663 RepID=A0AAW7M2Y9_9MICO|nr:MULTISPECIES: ABC transporter ATP-binding protein [unclassified Demequina]MDN4479032.1 ABC transporter ATP-binding protein [Demequina sp. SYSU T00039-1]MDN4489049.1 ABC transporter ATP-binding protein [Demequina sp. SYSU T00039]MDN4491240.1 ABC transporter ATP-binding protein [Demequina sp. SYSU T00068]